MTTTAPSPGRLYFAYGSNLSLEQMARRCPESRLHGLGVLPGFEWVIGERGYANVVRTAAPPTPDEPGVYGLLYELGGEGGADEAALDGYEGVSWVYKKVFLPVKVLADNGRVLGEVQALVYVDPKTGTGTCKEEYVGRMNRGLKDAIEKGVPAAWVEKVIRPFVPA
jgi:gamma-glutamylcyclotransferase